MNTIGAITVVVALLGFWNAANTQATRLAKSIDTVGRDAQSTRDAVMELTGKVDNLTSSAARNVDFNRQLDERVRALELRVGR